MRTLQQSSSKFSIFLTFFLDNLGVAVIFPIFTPLFLDARYAFFKTSPSPSEGSILLGLLIAAFPVAQFFGAPLIGDISDQIGRKKAFTFTILGSSLGYILIGAAIEMHMLPLLYIARMLTGLFSGNLTICLASLVDMSPTQQERAKNFSLLATIGGLSFISSITIGGVFSNANIFSAFRPSLPFWIIASMFLINLCLILAFFKESHPTKMQEKFHFLKGVHNIIEAWKIPHLKWAYLTFLFYMTGWISCMQFMPAYFLRYYALSTMQITYIFMGVGFFWSSANFLYSKLLSKSIPPRGILNFTLVTLGIFLFLFFFLLQQSLTSFLLHYYFCVMLAAVSWSNCLANVSLQANIEIQGRVLGINQSFASIAAITGPIVAGLLAGIDIKLVYLFSSIMAFTAMALLLSQLSKKK